MGRIEIDNIDEQVIAGIRARAKLHNRSFDDEVRSILKEGALFTPTERAEWARRVRGMTPRDVEQTDSTEMIRALRDA